MRRLNKQRNREDRDCLYQPVRASVCQYGSHYGSKPAPEHGVAMSVGAGLMSVHAARQRENVENNISTTNNKCKEQMNINKLFF